MALDRRILAAAGIVLGVGLLGGAYVLHHRRVAALPTSWPAPPTSASVGPALEELGRAHPNLKKLAEDPKVGSVLKEFAAAYSTGGVDKARAFARDRGFMNGQDDVTLTVLTESDETADLEAELRTLKAQIVGRGDRQIDVLVPWSVVEEAIKKGQPPEELISRMSGLKDVRGILPMERPEKNQSPFGSSRAADGVGVTHADRWHSAGFRGAGVKIGVLDPEVSKVDKFMGSVLPSNLAVYKGACVNQQGLGVDEEGLHGVAAAEIVHAMAPDAQLYLACSLGDDDAAVQWLVKQGVRIISYSAGGIYGPRNGTGRSQSRINKLTAQGILWVNAAGNDGQTFHRGQLRGTSGWHSFPSGRGAMGFKTKSVDGSVKISLLWNEWSSALVSDYDLYLFDSGMNEIARSENRNAAIRQPSETITKNLRPGGSYYIGIRGGVGVRAASFVLNIHNAASIEFKNPAGSLGQPSDAAGSLTVGAVVWNTNVLAPYSSRGPTEDGRIKPEISAPTEIRSTVYKGTFAGTSSATPHVSGAAALVWGRFPQYSRDQVASFLLGRVRDLGPPGPDNDYGYGMLDLGDVAAAAAPPAKPIAVAPAMPTATSTAPRPGSGGGSDDDDSTGRFIISVLLLGAVGGFVLIGGVVSLAVSLLRGGRPAAPRPAPARHAPPPHAPSWQPPRAAPGGPPQGSGGSGRGAPPWPPGGGARGAAGGPSGGQVAQGAGSPARMAYGPGATVLGGEALGAGGWVATLTVVEGPGAGQTVRLGPGAISVGRSPGNQIIVPDAMVSSRHAWIESDETGCWVRDAGSRNGVFVNGVRVDRRFLQPGDVISLGPARLRFDVTAG